MASQNIPDRIKLILQFVVFTFCTWLLLIMLSLFTGVFRFYPGNNLRPFFWGFLVASFVIQLIRLIYKWRELVMQEEIGQVPDMQNPINITTIQAIILIVDIMLLVSGTILYSCGSNLLGSICFALLVIIWFIDKAYTKKRLCNIDKVNEMQL